MDELEEALEHQDFMDYMAELERRIFLAYMAVIPAEPLTAAWNDIRTYGNEPVFMDLLFDKMIEEAKHESD